MPISFVIKNDEEELLTYDWGQFVHDFGEKYLSQVSTFSTKATKLNLIRNIGYDLLKEFKKGLIRLPPGIEDK